MAKPEKDTTWKADFRCIEALPDTKAVRTSFYYNILACLALFGAGYYVINVEIQINEKKSELSRLNAEIEKNNPANLEAIKFNTKYKELKRKIEEIDTFINPAGPKTLDLIREISNSIPPQVIAEVIEHKKDSVKITAHVKAQAEQATKIAHDLEQKLNANSVLLKYFNSIAIGNVLQDPQNDRMNFEITMNQVPQKPVVKK